MNITRLPQVAAICLTIAVSLTRPLYAQIVMNYTHAAGTITTNYQSDGGIFKSTPGYTPAGNGTASISITSPSPATPPAGYKIWAVAGLDGFGALFHGSSATGTVTVSGTYTVAGAPAGGANGTLSGTATYNNYIGAAGVAQLLGTGSTTITSNIAVNPFTAQTPGPAPATTTVSAGIGTSSGGDVNNVAAPFTNAAVVPNGNYPVNFSLNVTASRTGGAVTSTAAWISLSFNWSLAAPANGQAMNIIEQGIAGPTDQTPVALTGTLTNVATSFSPATLAMNNSGQLYYSSLNPSSLSDPATYNASGPSFQVGNAAGLGYLADLKMSPGGQLYGLQSFGYASGNFNLTNSSLMTINPVAGTTTPISLSRTLTAPSALAFGQGGVFSSNTLVTELGLSAGSTPALDSIDGSGHVTTLISSLGFANPVGMAVAPANFGGLNSQLFILSAGQFSSNTMMNNTGGVYVINNQNLGKSTFLSGLNNPLSFAFADGSLLGHPGTTYLYVLNQGDLNPTTGFPLGDGTLTGYDALGNATIVADNLLNPTSLKASSDGTQLFFTAGDTIYNLAAPEPSSLMSLAVGTVSLLTLSLRRRRRTTQN